MTMYHLTSTNSSQKGLYLFQPCQRSTQELDMNRVSAYEVRIFSNGFLSFLFRLWQRRGAVVLVLVIFALFFLAYYTEGAHQQARLLVFILNCVNNQHRSSIRKVFKGYR